MTDEGRLVRGRRMVTPALFLGHRNLGLAWRRGFLQAVEDPAAAIRTVYQIAALQQAFEEGHKAGRAAPIIAADTED